MQPYYDDLRPMIPTMSAEGYKKALSESLEVAGPGRTLWNEAFRSALKVRGLTLAHPGQEVVSGDLYPDGHPYQSPLPFGEIDAWPEGAVVVWTDDV